SVTINEIKNSKGTITGYNGVLKDFSQRVSTQKKIEDIVSGLESCLQFTNTGITKYRTYRDTFSFYDSFSQLLGYNELCKDCKISQFFELMHQNERENVKEIFKELLNKTNSSFTILCRFQNVDGKYLLFSNKFSINNVDKLGNISEIVGIHVLIEKQRELELNILDHQRKLAAVYNSTKTMFFLLNKNLIITDINNATAEYFDKSKTEIQGKKIDKLFLDTKFEKLANELLSIISNSVKNKANISNQEMSYTQGENTHHFVVSTHIYIGENDLNCLLTIDDVTTQKTFEQQTQNKLNILEKKEQETIALIGKISDEIRYPITEILNEATSNPIKKNARKILDIIENINNLASLKSETYSINIERFNVIECLDNIKESLMKIIDNNIQIICNPMLALGLEFIYTDPGKLKSLITGTVLTIVNNCSPKIIEIGVNYVERSYVLFIKVVSKKEKINPDTVMLEILKDLASKISTSFNIEITASNEAIYKFAIKDTSYNPKTETLKYHDLRNIKILIVEDEEYNIFYLSKILQMAGYGIVVAEDGQKAIDAVKQDSTINLVLMDIRLPGIDGIEASKRIKAFNPDLPIIAQTAFNLNSKEDQDMDKYCDDYIQKPIISKVLYQKIESNLKMNL
ncbi:MAG: response regulator, partial [Bacteroidales bacterium]|nr:response regulator [Bacteroidales bacterium]